MTRRADPLALVAKPVRIRAAENDILLDVDGRRYVDLLGGSGTVLLGHANPAIARAIQGQLDTLWCTGVLPTREGADASAAIDAHFEPSHRLAVLYSTGMEAAEFALRMARQVTGRRGVVGFAGSMHGKSLATAKLAWPNPLVELPDCHTVPYLAHTTEDDALAGVRAVMREHEISAVFVEPLLGSSGGHVPSREFCRELATLCTDHGALLVVDEILTGFYRTGTDFLHRHLGVTPDIVLVGKAMGNGFPVSGVVAARRLEVDPSMLPGSTYAGNPLAAAAVTATLAEMARLDLPASVATIEGIVRESLAGLDGLGIALRGKGALWILEFPAGTEMPRVMADIVDGGVMVSLTSRYMRLLPAATIDPDNLSRACEVIRGACEAHVGSGR